MINLIETTKVRIPAILALNNQSIREISTLKDAETRLSNPIGLYWKHIRIIEPSNSKIFNNWLQNIIDNARPRKKRKLFK